MRAEIRHLGRQRSRFDQPTSGWREEFSASYLATSSTMARSARVAASEFPQVGRARAWASN